MATTQTTTPTAPNLTKWRGMTVLFGATDREARILGYMWDAMQRTTRRAK
jgi:hypothetical protein